MQPQNKILIRPLSHSHTYTHAYSQPQTHAKCSVFASTRTAATAAAAAQSTLSLLRRGACVFVCVAGRRVNALHREVQGWTNQSFAQRVHDHGVRAYKHTIAQIYLYMYVCVCVWDCAWVACLHTYPYYYRCVCNYLHPIRAFSLCIYLHVHMYVCTYLHVCMCTYPNWYLWII